MRELRKVSSLAASVSFAGALDLLHRRLPAVPDAHEVDISRHLVEALVIPEPHVGELDCFQSHSSPLTLRPCILDLRSSPCGVILVRVVEHVAGRPRPTTTDCQIRSRGQNFRLYAIVEHDVQQLGIPVAEAHGVWVVEVPDTLSACQQLYLLAEVFEHLPLARGK